jgi:hypothetical protein
MEMSKNVCVRLRLINILLILPVEDAAVRCPVGGNHRTGACPPLEGLIKTETYKLMNVPKLGHMKSLSHILFFAFLGALCGELFRLIK